MAAPSKNKSGQPVIDTYLQKTQPAGTPIVRVVPPRADKRANITTVIYKCSTTAHDLTFLVALGTATVTSEAATGQAVVTLSDKTTASDTLAANDYIVLVDELGVWDAYLVSSVSGLNVTVSANFATKIPKGSTCYLMMAPADHVDRIVTMTVSVDNTLTDPVVGIATATNDNEPLMVYSANGTAAGTIKQLSMRYVDV